MSGTLNWTKQTLFSLKHAGEKFVYIEFTKGSAKLNFSYPRLRTLEHLVWAPCISKTLKCPASCVMKTDLPAFRNKFLSGFHERET